MSNEPTYLFYDLETTGLNKCFDQVVQFAAIRTNMALDELERYDIIVKLNNDVIPSPYATITHRIGIEQCNQGISELEAITQIHQLINTPNTISIGYNTLGFDDEFLRFSFYRNLLAPYTHQYASGCSRMDLYPIAVMYYLFNPDAITWPIIDGRPSMKLEHINTANHFVDGQAHNAMVDVEATLAFARSLRMHPDKWEYLKGNFHKNTDLERSGKLPPAFSIANTAFREALLINGKVGSQALYQAPVLGLGQHAHYKNQSLWLRLDNELLSQCTLNNIEKNTFVYRKKPGESLLLLPPQERFLKHLTPERLELANKNKQWLQDNPDILNAICDYHQQFTYPKVPNLDIDAALYELSFPTSREEFLFQRFHLAQPEEKATVASQFPNPIRKEQALRIVGRHFPEHLNSADEKMYQEYREHIYKPDESTITDYRNQTHLTPKQALKDIEEIRANKTIDEEQKVLLDELEAFLRQ